MHFDISCPSVDKEIRESNQQREGETFLKRGGRGVGGEKTRAYSTESLFLNEKPRSDPNTHPSVSRILAPRSRGASILDSSLDPQFLSISWMASSSSCWSTLGASLSCTSE